MPSRALRSTEQMLLDCVLHGSLGETVIPPKLWNNPIVHIKVELKFSPWLLNLVEMSSPLYYDYFYDCLLTVLCILFKRNWLTLVILYMLIQKINGL